MKKILLSIATIALVGAGVAGFTTAFYGDTERSTGNTFVAGSVELRVDSVAHFNNMICVDGQWQPEGEFQPGPEHYPQPGDECDGSWLETDLEDGIHRYFNFLDLKPGDWGENTISLHVYDNDAWGQFLVENVVDRDNTCTEPEQTAENDQCSDPDGDGEVDNYLRFTAWLDQGTTPGFQCGTEPNNAECEADEKEGDNIYQETEGPLIWDDELINELGPFELSEVLALSFEIFTCGNVGNQNGHNNYEECHGLAEDGRMVGSTTYYFGLAWHLDLQETGNDAQTDEYTADMIFQVEQHRNNPDPFPQD